MQTYANIGSENSDQLPLKPQQLHNCLEIGSRLSHWRKDASYPQKSIVRNTRTTILHRCLYHKQTSPMIFGPLRSFQVSTITATKAMDAAPGEALTQVGLVGCRNDMFQTEIASIATTKTRKPPAQDNHIVLV